jgi:hypothetical protein
MRNFIFGIIGILWGGLILVGYLVRGAPSGDGAYKAGTMVALVFGALLFLAGIYYTVDGVRSLQGGPKKKKKKKRPRVREEEPDSE